MEQPKILRINVQAVSQVSLKLLDDLRAEIRVIYYCIRVEEGNK